MIRYIIFAAIFVGLSHSAKKYRVDYIYDSKTDAFYKLHTESVVYDIAKETCKAEGTKLVTASQADTIQTHGMLKQYPDIGERVWAFTEWHDEGLQSEEIDVPNLYASIPSENIEYYGGPCEVISRTGEIHKWGCLNKLAFVCKVAAKDAPYDPTCGVYSRGYQYKENVGSCYKISSEAFSWNQAYAECQAEGAHLLVLNSELEHQTVHNLTSTAPKISVNAHAPWYWLAGIRAGKPENHSSAVYKTIFGQTLQEAGFDQWSEGEPNNLGGNELCGSIFTNDGKYNDVNCSHLFAFICEKEVKAKI